jgi:type IV pilus assembly protein PilV
MKCVVSMKSQKGVLLLEAMIAILLFSVGVLAVVGLQANAIKNVAQSKYRSDASFLADQVLGEMWANRNNVATYAYAGSGSAPAVVSAWVTQVQQALPNSQTYPPTIAITTTNYVGPPTYAAHQITVTVRWQTADEFSATPRPAAHQHTTTALITCC